MQIGTKMEDIPWVGDWLRGSLREWVSERRVTGLNYGCRVACHLAEASQNNVQAYVCMWNAVLLFNPEFMICTYHEFNSRYHELNLWCHEMNSWYHEFEFVTNLFHEFWIK